MLGKLHENKYTMYIGIILSIALSCFSMNDIYNIEVKNISMNL